MAAGFWTRVWDFTGDDDGCNVPSGEWLWHYKCKMAVAGTSSTEIGNV